MSKNTGGPAFPNDGVNKRVKPQEGMTLRDYFMAHAPAEPQPWFIPAMPDQPKSRWISKDWMREYQNVMDAYKAEGFDGYRDANSDVREVWELAYEKARYTQWPAAWADEQLKERMK